MLRIGNRWKRHPAWSPVFVVQGLSGKKEAHPWRTYWVGLLPFVGGRSQTLVLVKPWLWWIPTPRSLCSSLEGAEPRAAVLR